MFVVIEVKILNLLWQNIEVWVIKFIGSENVRGYLLCEIKKCILGVLRGCLFYQGNKKLSVKKGSGIFESLVMVVLWIEVYSGIFFIGIWLFIFNGNDRNLRWERLCGNIQLLNVRQI